jgi:hypothetical protein
MNHRRSTYLLGAIFILATTTAAYPGSDGSSRDRDKRDHTEVKALASGCLSHRESFPSITCKFTYVQGTADAITVAIRGQPGDIHTTTTSAMRWLVDKQSVLLEHAADPAIWKEAEAKARPVRAPITVPVLSQSILTNGSYRLDYFQDWKGASIFGHDGPSPLRIRLTPFDMGVMGDNEALSPGNLLTECVRGNLTCQSITTEPINGHEILIVEILHPKQTRIKYWLDPERGFLPIQRSSFGSTGREIARAYWTDIRKCSGNRWFPWRAVRIDDPNKGGGPFRVEEIRVNSLDVDTPPARASFRVTIPKGIQLHAPNTQFAVCEPSTDDEAVGLDDLAKLHKRCLDIAPIRVAAQAKWDAEQAAAAGPWHFGIITAIMAMVLGTLGIVRWRYLARRRPA